MGTIIPSGTTQARPAFPAIGSIRYNTNASDMEAWDGSNWQRLDQMSITFYKLEFSSGTVFGKTYSIAEPKGNPPFTEMIKWCNETLGPTADDGVWTPDMRWYVNDSKFCFRDERDRTMFSIRWSA
jgi:hypothetical protein